jgi:RNA-binding protein 25
MFLERQMEEMRATQEEQKRAGLLVDDAAPIRFNVKTKQDPASGQLPLGSQKGVIFGQEDEEEMVIKKKRVPLVELDFVVDGEKAKEKLEGIRKQVTRDRESLWKAKIRWEAISDVGCVKSICNCLVDMALQSVIDRKLEPLIHRKIEEYLGEIDDDLVMFVLEHIKDRKGPGKLVDELQSVSVQLIIHGDITYITWIGPCRRSHSIRCIHLATNSIRKRVIWRGAGDKLTAG